MGVWTMRIGIIGAGAIGCVVGGMLTKAGRDVTLIDQWPEHVEAMKRPGLRLSGTCGDHVIRVKALHVHELQRVTEPFDAVFIAVKSYDTEWATALALGYLARPNGVVVDFQNGINDLRVAAVAGRERTLGCVITIGAGMYEPGHAMRTDTQTIGFKIGDLDGPRHRPAAGRHGRRRQGAGRRAALDAPGRHAQAAHRDRLPQRLRRRRGPPRRREDAVQRGGGAPRARARRGHAHAGPEEPGAAAADTAALSAGGRAASAPSAPARDDPGKRPKASRES